MAFEFPFEKSAMRGEVPDDLNLIDAGACHKLAAIYREWRNTKDEHIEATRKARMAKESLRRDWEFARKREERQTRLWKETEIAAERCRKNPTTENALALCNAIAGIGGDH